MTGPIQAGPERRHRASLRCHAGDVSFVITAPADWLPAQREYLSQFLPPPPGDLKPGSFSIRIHTSDRQFRQADTAATASPSARRIEPVPGLIMLESLQATGRRCYSIAEDAVEGLPGAYAVTVRQRRISIYLHSETRRPHRYPIRILREAMLRTYEDAGGIIFHAAGIDVSGAGVMICGPAGAGKTTVASALLRHAGTTFVSGDRIVAIAGRRMVAVPLPVNAARGTIEAFGELRTILNGDAAGQAGTSMLPADFGTRVKRSFTPSQFAGAFSAGFGSASTLQLVVVPRLTDTAAPASLERLRGSHARSAIAESCFTPRDEFWITPWIIPRHTPDSTLQRRADTMVDAITAEVPCFRVCFGVRGPLSGLEGALKAVVEEVGS